MNLRLLCACAAALLACMALVSVWDVDSPMVSSRSRAILGQQSGRQNDDRWRQERRRHAHSQASMSRAQKSEEKSLSDLKLLESAKESQARDTKKDTAERDRDMRSARKLHEIHRQLMRQNTLLAKNLKGTDNRLLQEALDEQKIENKQQTTSFQRDFEAAEEKKAGPPSGARPSVRRGSGSDASFFTRVRASAPAQKILAKKESSIKKDLEIVLGTQFDNSVMGAGKDAGKTGRGGQQAAAGAGGTWDALWKHKKKKKPPALLGTDDEKRLVRFLTSAGGERAGEAAKAQARLAEQQREHPDEFKDGPGLRRGQAKKLVQFLDGATIHSGHHGVAAEGSGGGSGGSDAVTKEDWAQMWGWGGGRAGKENRGRHRSYVQDV